MAFQWLFAKDTPAEYLYYKGVGRAVVILPDFNLLIGNWIIKMTHALSVD